MHGFRNAGLSRSIDSRFFFPEDYILSIVLGTHWEDHDSLSIVWIAHCLIANMAEEWQAPEHDFHFKDEISAINTPAISPDLPVDDGSQDEEIHDRKSDSLW
jgi:hypothetical protein